MATDTAGFTLVELLIVIIVLGALFVFFLTVFDPVKQLGKARDAQRQHDLFSIQTVLDTYFHDKNCYPQNLSDLQTAYIPKLPTDPVTKNAYIYETDPNPDVPDCSQWIVLYAKLSAVAPLACQLAANCRPLNVSSANYACIPLGNVNCVTINGYTIP